MAGVALAQHGESDPIAAAECSANFFFSAAAQKAVKRLVMEQRVAERRRQMALEKQARQDARVEASTSFPSIDSVAEDNARAGPVFISGATGPRAEVINGFYEATEEKGLDGRVVYMKRGDGSVCIEHFGGLWRVKFVSWKGTNMALADVIGFCAFEACDSRVWRVWVGGKVFQDQPSVKMLTGAEAELQVSGCSTFARELNAA
jgi:hypothetical protein